MLSEEGLVLVVALGAVALLILGVLELVAPTRPRHPRRPPTFVRDPWRRGRRTSLTGRRATIPKRAAPAVEATPAAPLPPLAVEPERVEVWIRPESEPEPVVDFPLSAVREPTAENTAAAAPYAPAEPIAAPSPLTEPTGVELPPVEPGPLAEIEPVRAPLTEPEPLPEPEPVIESALVPLALPSPVERCYALYEAQQFDEVVAAGMAALETASSDPRVREPEEVARLWGVVGLARQALGDQEAAREAFAEAITAAPDGERQTWERHLAALVLQVGRELQARSESPGIAGARERVDAMRSAISWLEGGVALAPEDEALAEAAASAREALWSTYEHVAMEQMQRQDYEEARWLLEEALQQAECPPEFQETFRELLSGTHGGAVGQLTAEALRRMREGAEREALAALDRAEALLATIPEDGLPERRRQELERRLWWSYTKVGIRWLEGGMYEQALPPLLHALRFGSVGAPRLDETRRPLARALGGLVEDRAPLIQRLIDGADRPEGRVLCDRLWAHVQDALDAGMTKEELGEPLKRLHELRERLDEGES